VQVQVNPDHWHPPQRVGYYGLAQDPSDLLQETIRLDFTHYLGLFRRSLLIIILLPVLAGAVAYGVSKALPPIYEARVSLLVRPSQPLALTDSTGATLTSDQVSRTYARLMTERPLLEQVISDRKLHISVEELQNQIKITPELATTIIDVAVDNTDRSAAQANADTLVSDFIAGVKRIQQAEAQTPNSRSTDNLVVVAPAAALENPVSPRTPLNVAIAVALGLLAAMGLAVLRDRLDQSIKSDEQLLERVGLTTLGHVGFVIAGTKRLGELVAMSKNSPTAEAYKSLRTNVLFSALGDDLKSILVTSAAPDEGKSRTAANLAVVLAAAGKRTLLVDADFRRPSQHRIFGKVRNIGLSNLVLEDIPQDKLFNLIEDVPNLWFLASGPIPPNPSELLGSNRVKGLLAEFRQTFDYVIIDSPPVNAVTDPTILAAEVDATVLVAEEGRTTYAALAHAKGALDRVSANILGVVINKIRAQAGGYHYYEYGSYSSSNGSQPSAETTATEAVATIPSRRGPAPAPATPVPGEPSPLFSPTRPSRPEPGP
jgi:receptor protein-tyrosine kinase